MKQRCYKGLFLDGSAPLSGYRRCWGGCAGNSKWGRCRYLPRCLHMPVDAWLKRNKSAIRSPWMSETLHETLALY